jgi:competence protein ComEA
MARARTLTLLAASLLLSLSGWALEVNDATEAQLDGVRGLGPSQTARILQAREAGPFKNWTDFMARVKGIKAPTAAKLSTQGLTVGGTPYPGATP